MLVMQIIEIMDKLWLKEGLDLRMVTFGVLATDDRKGSNINPIIFKICF